VNYPFIMYSLAIWDTRFQYRDTRFQVGKAPLFHGSALGTSWLEDALFTTFCKKPKVVEHILVRAVFG
jgi:hypothetical protein